MTREELCAVVEAVLDAPAPWQGHPDRIDTIMRAADAYAGTTPPRRITMRDESLPHQIVIFTLGSEIAVSCNCLRGIDGTQAHYSPLEVRYRWEPDEPMLVWRSHVAALETAGAS